MDGVNRALDNIYIERFWRMLKYEDIYLNDYRTLSELKAGSGTWISTIGSDSAPRMIIKHLIKCMRANSRKSRPDYAMLYSNSSEVESTLIT